MSVKRRWLTRSLVCCSLLATACGEKGTPVPNIDPETTITGSIPREAGSTAHHVEFFWSGGDVDGVVTSWQYILEEYPRSVAQYSNIQPVEPGVNDSRWTTISRSNVKLVLVADTLRADPAGDIGDGKFDRWHTFWVRSVDNEAGFDQTPAKVTFSAFTKAPEMWMNSPVVAAQAPMLPSSFVMNWDGADDIGSGDFQNPMESRWVLKVVQLDGGGQPIGYPEALYNLPESEWSDWVEWGAADSTGREAVFLERLPGGAFDTAFVFAVQGRDDAGAITPQFDKDTPRKNNYGAFVLSHTLPVGPEFRVHANLDTLQLGNWDFMGSAATAITVFSPGGAVSVNWDVMVTRNYGANPGDYRFAWNIADPGNEDLWSAWGSVRVSPPQQLLQATEELQIQARDHIGQVTTAILRFQKVP